jgi:hypothetical protein
MIARLLGEEVGTLPPRQWLGYLLFLQTNHVKEYRLSPSVVAPCLDNRYANMNDVNVNFNDSLIVYNYPIESHIYVLDMKTGKRTVLEYLWIIRWANRNVRMI